MTKPLPILMAAALWLAAPVHAQIVVLRFDDAVGGFTASTALLEDDPIANPPPAIGDKDGLWGFDSANAQALTPNVTGTEADRLAGYVWGSRTDWANATTPGENAPALTVNLGGLDAGTDYNIHLYYVTSTATTTWGIKASLGADPLATYGLNDGSLIGTRYLDITGMERVRLGTVTGSATATVNIDDLHDGVTFTSARGFIKGVGIEPLSPAPPAGNAGDTYIHGDGHAIAAKWGIPSVAADFLNMGLTCSDSTQALAISPGRAALSFTAASIDAPLHATLDTREDGVFAGLLSGGLIAPTDGSIYFSVLLRLPGGLDSSDWGFFALSAAPGSGDWTVTEILRCGKLINQDTFGCRIPSTSTTLSSAIVPDGQPHLFVGRIDFTAGADTLTVWLDPEFSLAEDDAAQVAPLGTDTGNFAFMGYQFRGNMAFEADELRIGETWRSVLPIRDSDHDSLDDEWEILHWGDLSPLPGDDPDGDGADNLDEFLAGTDPLRADSRLTTDLAGDAVGYMLEWYGSPGRHYRIQESPNLSDWFDLAGEYAGDGRLLRVALPDTTDPRQFYRIQAGTQPSSDTP